VVKKVVVEKLIGITVALTKENLRTTKWMDKVAFYGQMEITIKAIFKMA
jgi:hypothetical protein